MEKAFADVVDLSQEHRSTLRDGAVALGIKRILEAEKKQQSKH